jgi:DNA gyrase/topoisomerase IV subunit B
MGDDHGSRTGVLCSRSSWKIMAETENIFSTLMGEDVEARRKFIEDNALDVKNLDI